MENCVIKTFISNLKRKLVLVRVAEEREMEREKVLAIN